MRFSIATVLSAALSLVSACTKAPSGQNVGNPIHTPGLNQAVPAGVPFAITWQPTSPGPVSLVLRRGPSENNVPILCIIESIPNSGSYSWTPPTTLEADVTHYGLQIIDDVTGDYQYSTQFGISNPASGHSTSTTTSSSSGTHNQDGQTTHSLPPFPSTLTPFPTSLTPITSTPATLHPITHSLPPFPSTLTPYPTSLTPDTSTLILNTTSVTIPTSALIPSYHNTTSLQLTLPASLRTSTLTADLPSGTGAGSVTVDVNVNATRTGGLSTTGTPPTGTTTASASVVLSTGGAGRVGAAGLVAGLGCVAAMIL